MRDFGESFFVLMFMVFMIFLIFAFPPPKEGIKDNRGCEKAEIEWVVK
jgi:hypothetical protein